jgi:DNA-directed RNA polymerase
LATPAQIEEQVNFERDAIKCGLDKLRKQTKDLEDKQYASATAYGTASMDMLLPLVVERIEETVEYQVKRGKNGVSFKHIHEYLRDVEPLAAAGIALKVTFDRVFSTKDGASQLVNVTDAIGQAVEQECQMQYYERVCPGLLKVIKDNYWHRACGTHQKLVVVRTLINRSDVTPWKTWQRDVRVKLGNWLLSCIMDASGWFTRDMQREGRKTVNYVIATPDFMKIKDEVMAQCELFSPIAYPMLIEPNNWTNERHGGYLLNEIRMCHDLVRRGDRTRIQGETPLAALNKIQKVAYTLNPFVTMVANHLMDKGISVGKFIPIVDYPLPVKPVDIDTNKEARQSYKRDCAEIYNKKADVYRRSCRTRMTMEAVDLFKDKEMFFIPHSFDYRGRMYPIPSFLTMQDTDFGKSLLKFYEGSKLTPDAEDWLSFQVATTYGHDKETIKYRLEWTTNNHHLITRIAEDPIGCLPDWESAEEPWLFLAACDEYYHCCIKRDRDYTALPVAVDATCSGLQILAGLCRDASTASLVNVLPGKRPADAYRTVAEHAKPNVPESIRPHMDRKVVKRVVMTVPYNAKPHSNRGYIRDALKEKGVEIEKDDLTKTVKAVRAAMDEIVPGPMAVMTWFETEVGKAIKRGESQLQWCTPSGFVVTQRLMKKLFKDVELQLLGRVKIRVSTEDSDKVDLSHHKNATAPNVIHSLDASLLHLASLRFDAPLSVIHDSVLCRATDMSALSSIVREVYMHLFAEHDYLKDFAAQIGAETEPPIIGDLKPESVIESTYFFC